MKAIEERYYFQKKDHGVKFLNFFGKNKTIKKAVVFLFSLFFKLFRTYKKNKSGNIVVVSLLRLGDTVFSIPALKIIYDTYQGNNVTIVCYPESESIYKLAFNNPVIKPVGKENFSLGRRLASSEARKIIRQLKPEIIFDLTGSVTSATLIFNSGASKVAGRNSELFKSVYTHFGLHRTLPHFIDIYLDVVELLIKFKRTEEMLQFPTTIESHKKIIIHPYAIRKAKEWDLNKFIKLAAVLSEDYTVEIISPEGYTNSETIARISELNISFTVTKTVEDLINIIRGCSVFISNDSGPTYIAALLGKPTFTIYGPTNQLYSLPFGKNHSYFRKMLECSAKDDEKYCNTDAGIYCPHHNCLNLVPVDEVYSSVKSFLERLHISVKSSKNALVN